MYAAPRTELRDALPAPTLDALLVPFTPLPPLAFSNILRKLASLRWLVALRGREAAEPATEAAWLLWLMPELAVPGLLGTDAEPPKELKESAVWGRNPLSPWSFHAHPSSEAAEAAAVLREAILEALFGRLSADDFSVFSAPLSAVAALKADFSEGASLLPRRLLATSLLRTETGWNTVCSWEPSSCLAASSSIALMSGTTDGMLPCAELTSLGGLLLPTFRALGAELGRVNVERRRAVEAAAPAVSSVAQAAFGGAGVAAATEEVAAAYVVSAAAVADACRALASSPLCRAWASARRRTSSVALLRSSRNCELPFASAISC